MRNPILPFTIVEISSRLMALQPDCLKTFMSVIIMSRQRLYRFGESVARKSHKLDRRGTKLVRKPQVS